MKSFIGYVRYAGMVGNYTNLAVRFLNMDDIILLKNDHSFLFDIIKA